MVILAVLTFCTLYFPICIYLKGVLDRLDNFTDEDLSNSLLGKIYKVGNREKK